MTKGSLKVAYDWNVKTGASRTLEAHTNQECISAWTTLILKPMLFVILDNIKSHMNLKETIVLVEDPITK